MVILDRRVQVVLPAAGRDATGGAADGPPRETRTVWAAKNDTAARTELLSGREDSATMTTFTVNFQALDNRWHVVEGETAYRITGVLEREGRRYLDLLCEAVK